MPQCTQNSKEKNIIKKKKKTEGRDSKKYLYIHIQRSITHYSENVEAYRCPWRNSKMAARGRKQKVTLL
jgi:hypothetical protein